MNVTFSYIGGRWQLARYLKRINRSKDFSVITVLDHRRIGFCVWYIKFEAEIKVK